jgi:hypothetical protein
LAVGLLQGRPDKPDIRVCRLPDIKRKMINKRASVKDGGEQRVPRRGDPCLLCRQPHRHQQSEACFASHVAPTLHRPAPPAVQPATTWA